MKQDDRHRPARRAFLGRTAGLVAVAGVPFAAQAAPDDLGRHDGPHGGGHGADPHGGAAYPETRSEPFYGVHQGGIATRAQAHSYFAALDLTTTERNDVIQLFKTWTLAAARLTQGQPIEAFRKAEVAYDTDATVTTTTSSDEPVASEVELPDSGDVIESPAARLTVTFGFGPGLFVKDGKDRYGLAAQRPAALVDLPTFVGDQLVEAHTGGDLSVQACAEDPQVAFHAVRQLVRLASEVAQVRWAQVGFLPRTKPGQTPRNLMGFKDGSNNVRADDPATMDRFVWVGDEGPAWMRGGSYLVARRIRIALEHWDNSKVKFQEQTVGRYKDSGAPLGATREFDTADLKARDKDGNLVIGENSHVRLASAEMNDGAQILRRPYSYNDGVNFTAERWPPWRQGLEYDAGLFFISYQRDPRTGFIKIFSNLAKLDMMNQFATHVGGGLFACPAGVRDGEYLGQRLFETRTA